MLSPKTAMTAVNSAVLAVLHSAKTNGQWFEKESKEREKERNKQKPRMRGFASLLGKYQTDVI